MSEGAKEYEKEEKTKTKENWRGWGACEGRRKKEDGQVRSFWATQVYPSKCYNSRRTSMDVLFVRFSRYIQIKPYIALHCIVVPRFFFPPTSLLGAIGFSATGELYFSYAILTTSVVVLTLYLYQYTRMMRGGPTI